MSLKRYKEVFSVEWWKTNVVISTVVIFLMMHRGVKLIICEVTL